MVKNKFGEIVLDQDSVFRALYLGQLNTLAGLKLDNETVTQFKQAVEKNQDDLAVPSVYVESDDDIEMFDRLNQRSWFIPPDYQSLDIQSWIRAQCQTDEQLDRVNQELELFDRSNMIDLLRFLKYLVDTMRSNGVVWGVGRGSSVASYVLYLIGVHKVDSIKYNIDIHEFFK